MATKLGLHPLGTTTTITITPRSPKQVGAGNMKTH